MSRTQKQEVERPVKPARKQRLRQVLRAQSQQRGQPDCPLPDPPRWSPMG